LAYEEDWVSKPRLACFDLDHTLLSGDSDVLWCEYLIDTGHLDRDTFQAKNADMEVQYKAGSVAMDEFANFYVGTLTGFTPAHWEPVRQAFLRECIIPRLPADAVNLVQHHRQAGDELVLTTATNRFITELTARHLGFKHLIATEPEIVGGNFSGKTIEVLNMREGKVARLAAWLASRGQSLGDFDSAAYSDSINDLPLLKAVNRAVAVDPDARLEAEAQTRGWTVLRLAR
jgi:HAD superfamily hydrolase (TIGR01490 family)